MSLIWKGKWPEDEKAKAELAINEGISKMEALGIKDLSPIPIKLYNSYKITCAGLKLQGIYRYRGFVQVACKTDELVHVVIHELGHAYFFNCLTDAQSVEFTAWVNQHTALTPRKEILHAVEKYNARTWDDLQRALLKHYPTLWYRCRYMAHKHMNTPPLDSIKKHIPKDIPLNDFLEAAFKPDIRTFRHPVSHHNLPYYEIGYPMAWEVFAEGFMAYVLRDPKWPIHPTLEKKIAQYMPGASS